MKHRAWAAALVLLVSRVAFADEPEPKQDNRARAQQLFDSALADAEAGNYAAACPKFLASQEADPKTSTLLNLGSCYEKNGQSASAWGAFREAEVLARRAWRKDWETIAHDRAEALAPKLVRLTIYVSENARVPGLVVTRDGAKLAPGEWGVAIPVDPGEHTVSASADGRAPFETKISVTDASKELEIPPLAAVVAPPVFPAATIVPQDARRWSTLKIAGAVTAGAGIATLVFGTVLAVVAKGRYDSARQGCQLGTRGCTADAVADGDAAYDLATASSIAFGIGAAALAGGGAVFFLAPGANGATLGAQTRW